MQSLNIKIKGKVVHGNGKGKTVGMPTANLEYDTSDVVFQHGVYASAVFVDKVYVGVTNIGTRPSVDNDEKVTIETNIIGFERDIYEETIEITLLSRIRDVMKFANLSEVKEQVDRDKIKAIEVYNILKMKGELQ